MKPSMRAQRGVSFLALLFYLVLVMIALTILLKLGPHYKEFLEVRSVMNDLSTDPSLAGKDRYAISRALDNRLYINYVYVVKPKDFKFTRADTGYRLSVKYEVKEALFANVAVLLTFSYAVHVGG